MDMGVDLWKDKSKKLIDPELFSAKAEALAKEIYKEQQESRGKENKPTQIRKFYDEIIRFDTMVKTNDKAFENILPYLKMLNAKAAYAMGRELVSKGFKDFISYSLGQIHTKEDFEVFADLFEAFMGYYKFYDKKGESMAPGGRR
ncbi:MAG: type III-A CRISPR-associated protein Csm2 [Thermodesulfovibrio sp. RBG_19FT_COMBO_42_12]|nr:MAG: type III-A CRISPR-associated protein Csm2 [Thermodesulfovibrio sp. RBG_19FT_COMBO_42_12]